MPRVAKGTSQVHLYVAPELRDRLVAEADAQHRSVINLVQHILRLYLESPERVR